MRDWHGYNEALVRRGEILLDLSLLQSWGQELEEMNRGREGADTITLTVSSGCKSSSRALGWRHREKQNQQTIKAEI